MTAEYTPGPLHLSCTSRDSMKAFDEVGNMVVSTDYSQHSTAQAIADIGRVVACWNACAGYDDPEDMAREAFLFRIRAGMAYQAITDHGGFYICDWDRTLKWETPGAREAVDALRGDHE